MQGLELLEAADQQPGLLPSLFSMLLRSSEISGFRVRDMGGPSFKEKLASCSLFPINLVMYMLYVCMYEWMHVHMHVCVCVCVYLLCTCQKITNIKNCHGSLRNFKSCWSWKARHRPKRWKSRGEAKGTPQQFQVVKALSKLRGADSMAETTNLDSERPLIKKNFLGL